MPENTQPFFTNIPYAYICTIPVATEKKVQLWSERLKSTFFEIFSPLRGPFHSKNFKNVDFILCAVSRQNGHFPRFISSLCPVITCRSNGQQGSDQVYDMNAINQRLIKLLDPSEHNSEYIIMVANNVGDTGSMTFLYGSLSYDMVTFLQRTYGLFQMVNIPICKWRESNPS